MRKLSLFYVLPVVAVMLVASRVDASVLSELELDVVNELTDTDYESHVFDTNNSGEVDEGDMLLAMFVVSDKFNKLTGTFNSSDDNSLTSTEIFSPTSATRTFTGVTLIKVDTLVESGAGAFANYTFKAATPTEWSTYGFVSDVDVGTMAVIFDDPPSSPHVDPAVDGGDLSSEIATATNGTRLWEVGFTGSGGAATGAEFWAAVAVDFGGEATKIDKIDNLTFFAAMNVVDNHVAAPFKLVKHNALSDPELSSAEGAAQFGGPVQMQLFGALQTGSAGNFDIKTNTNFYILPTPEPGSILIWAGVLGVGWFGTRRRRRKTA